jgi:predicted peptidase
MKTIINIFFLVLISIASQGQTLVPKPFPNPLGYYPYWEYKPDSAKALLFFVHGHGERGNGSYDFITRQGELNKVLNIGIPKLIKNGNYRRQDFIVIAPQYKLTSTSLYPQTFHDFVKSDCHYYKIDSTNVYMVGISGGGISVWNYIVKYSHVRAAVPIAGYANYKLAANAIKTRIWAVHGEDDTTIPINSVEIFQNNYNALVPKVPMRLDRIPNYGHESGVWDRACMRDKYYNWMLNK